MTVTTRDEVEVNGYKYKTKGPVTGAWLDPFPEAFTLGDADYANRRDLSSWIMNDIRYIGVEEMDEKKDLNFCWWTNGIIKYRNHILPPRLATSVTLPTHTNGDWNDAFSWRESSANWTLEPNVIDGSTTTYAASNPSGWSGYLEIFVPAISCSKIRYYWSEQVAEDVIDMEIDVYYDGAWHNLVDDDSAGEGAYAEASLGATKTVTAARCKMRNSGGGNMHLHSIQFYAESATVQGTFVQFENFNGEMYMAQGNWLAKLDADRAALSFVAAFLVDITKLVSSLNSRLYIFLGDSENYWYMTSTEIENCEDAWDESVDGDVTSTRDSTDNRVGTYSAKLVVATGCAANDILATEAISSTDITTYTHVTFLIKSTVALAADDLRFLIDEAANCANGDKVLAVPAVSANTWTSALINMGDVSALNAVISLGLEMQVDKDAFTVRLDDVRVVKFTESDSANANWGFQHDAKLFKCNTSGTVEYSTDPDDAAPTWTSAGAITDIADQIEGFVVGRDASGSYVPYAATNSIIKAYDSTTPQWIDTEAKLPNHPIGGQGHAYWNGKLYFSYGLACKEYYPETGAFLDIGLTERDGLPVEYNGEIVKLLGNTGVKGMFASIDASVTSGNSKSGLYLYDGFGWQCWWADTSNNGAMHDIIVSSAESGYAVYWDVGGAIYYIDIPRGIENPDKISQSYATAGIFISPWFDAGNPVAAKLAKVLEDFAKGITTTETVALYYRIDHTQTALDLDHSLTYWTLLETLNTTAETGHNEELFASGAGISFKAIQFRLDFVTPGATAKPDIQSLVLYFKKRTGAEKLRVWNVVLICDDGGSPFTTAKQKVANLESAIESTTDVLFSYHPNDASTESYYVTVNCNEFSEETGRNYEANYKLTLIES